MEDLGREADALSVNALGVDADALSVSHVGPRGVPVVHDPGFYERWLKSVLDFVVGVVLSVLLLPVIVLVAVAVMVSVGRPVMFRQTRVGRFGQEFTVLKFRTMAPDRRGGVEPFGGVDRRVSHKSDVDPRHTEVGRFLRKWSLDELPQFWNVARGEMSVVGPRPELPSVVGRYEPWQHRRHEVRPGLTGLWQVSARGDGPMHEATGIDIEYVENVSFVGDLSLLFKTPGAVLVSQKGN